ncbi:hypothetical protein VP01_2891g1, partial [Puccinia sorghi]
KKREKKRKKEKKREKKRKKEKEREKKKEKKRKKVLSSSRLSIGTGTGGWYKYVPSYRQWHIQLQQVLMQCTQVESLVVWVIQCIPSLHPTHPMLLLLMQEVPSPHALENLGITHYLALPNFQVSELEEAAIKKGHAQSLIGSLTCFECLSILNKKLYLSVIICQGDSAHTRMFKKPPKKIFSASLLFPVALRNIQERNEEISTSTKKNPTEKIRMREEQNIESMSIKMILCNHTPRTVFLSSPLTPWFHCKKLLNGLALDSPWKTHSSLLLIYGSFLLIDTRLHTLHPHPQAPLCTPCSTTPIRPPVCPPHSSGPPLRKLQTP